jgi:hypothetical protein
MSLLIILLIILILCAAFGGYGTWGPAPYGPAVSWSPLVAIIVIVVVLWALGMLR